MSVQGKAVNKTSGALLTTGNVTVRIYDASTNGNMIFNDTFNNTISNGTFNVLLGNQLQLNLTYNKMYHMELGINTETVIGSTARRQFFATGGPNQTILQVEESIGYVNITSQTASQPALRVIGASSQTANLTEWLNSGLTALAFITRSGGAYFNDSVGIGTASPGATLQVTGKANVLALNVNNTLYVNTTTSTVGIGVTSAGEKLSINNNFSVAGPNSQIDIIETDQSNKRWRVEGTGSNFAITEVGVSTWLTVATGGLIGIGTTSPAATLDIRGNISINEDLTIVGKIRMLNLSAVNDVFVYDTTKDSDGGAWTCDERAKASSWYNETLNDADRGQTRCFPKKAVLVTNGTSTQSHLYIYDAKDMSMWMVFDSQNSDLLTGGGTGNTLGPVFALNGKIYVGITAGDNGLAIDDFIADKGLLYYSANSPYTYKGTISERNDGKANIAGTGSGIVNTVVNDVHAAVINGKTYVAVATDGGVSVINEEEGVVVDVYYSSGDQARRAWIAKNGNLYYIYKPNTESLFRALAVKKNIPMFTSDQTVGNSRDYWYDEVGGSLLLGTSGTEKYDLFVTDGTSFVDGKSNTFYVGMNDKLAVINEKADDESNGCTKFYTEQYITEDMCGDIKGMWTMENGTADRSVRGTNLATGGGITLGGASGVRGMATQFDGTNDYLNATPKGDFNMSKANNFTLGAWVYPTQSGAGNIFNKSRSATGYALYIQSNGTAAFYVSDGTNTVAAQASANLNSSWHHVVGVLRNAVAEVYVDGTLVASTSATSVGSVDNTAELLIGMAGQQSTNAANNPFNGVIDEVFFTNESLTASQIKRMYEVGKRALQANDRGHNKILGTGSISTNITRAVAIDDKNEFIYVGTTSGGLSKIGIDSDTAIENWTANMRLDDNAAPFGNNTIIAVSSHSDVLAIGTGGGSATTNGVWIERANQTFIEHVTNSFNPHGRNLVQDEVTTNFINVKDGNRLAIGNNLNNISLALGGNLTVLNSTNNGPLMFFDRTNNNVGIGTTSPASRLEVTGAANVLALNVNNTLYVNTTGSFVGIGMKSFPSGWATSKLYIDQGTIPYAVWLSSDTNSDLVLRNSNTNYLDNFTIHHATGASWGSYIQFKTTAYIKSDIIFGTRTAGDVMTIKDSGNVGIGTTTPKAKFEVVGNITQSFYEYDGTTTPREVDKMIITMWCGANLTLNGISGYADVTTAASGTSCTTACSGNPVEQTCFANGYMVSERFYFDNSATKCSTTTYNRYCCCKA